MVEAEPGCPHHLHSTPKHLTTSTWSCCHNRGVDRLGLTGMAQKENRKELRIEGIEPPPAAWKADVIPLHQMRVEMWHFEVAK